MGISGTQRALMQARSGVMRSDASRAGYYAFRVVFTIDGTVRTTEVQLPATIVHGINDTPTTATFTIRSDAGFTPSIGQEVLIAYGATDNRIFGGQVISVDRVKRLARTSKALLQITAIDWRRLLDRRTVTRSWENASATAIALDIINDHTEGFSVGAVELGLSSIPQFQSTNVRPSELLRQLASLLGGGFYIDPNRVVHLFSSSGEVRGGYPSQINSSSLALKTLSSRRDFSQYRNRVICEGKSTRLMLALPAGYNVPLTANYVPIEDETGWTLADQPFRIGSQRLTATTVVKTGRLPGANPEGTSVRTAVAAGATSIPVDSVQFLLNQLQANGGPNPSVSTQFVKIGDQVIYAAGYGYSGTPSTNANLQNIPATGFGSIATPIEVDAQVTPVATAVVFDQAIYPAIPVGADVVVYGQADDAAAQAAMAAQEGGDGIHEYVFSGGDLDTTTATAFAEADLSLFSDEDGVLEASWETRDLGVGLGRIQSFDIAAPDALVAALTITTIVTTLDQATSRPTHAATATNSKQATLLDVVRVK